MIFTECRAGGGFPIGKTHPGEIDYLSFLLRRSGWRTTIGPQRAEGICGSSLIDSLGGQSGIWMTGKSSRPWFIFIPGNWIHPSHEFHQHLCAQSSGITLIWKKLKAKLNACCRISDSLRYQKYADWLKIPRAAPRVYVYIFQLITRYKCCGLYDSYCIQRLQTRLRQLQPKYRGQLEARTNFLHIMLPVICSLRQNCFIKSKSLV